jgi:hypothetical protein
MAEHNTPAVSRRSKTRISAGRGNPPTKTNKSDAPAANTPKAPADLAIPPDKLNAGNDK